MLIKLSIFLNLDMAKTFLNKKKIKNKKKVAKKISRQKYSPELLKEAVQMVKTKQMSFRVASEAFGVPSTTISDNLKSISKSNQLGRPPVLSEEIEKLLVDALIKLADWGFGLTKIQIKQVIQNYSISSNQNLFKNGIPGRSFFRGFLSRWNHVISRRLAGNLPVNRAAALSSHNINQFFDLCQKYYDYLDIHNKPQNVYNVDESGLSGSQGSLQIFCKKG
jgi:transposase-like protein